MLASGGGKNQIFSLQPLDGRSTFNYKNGLSNLKSKPAVRSVFLALLKIEISAFYTEISAISPQMKIWRALEEQHVSSGHVEIVGKYLDRFKNVFAY